MAIRQYSDLKAKSRLQTFLGLLGPSWAGMAFTYSVFFHCSWTSEESLHQFPAALPLFGKNCNCTPYFCFLFQLTSFTQWMSLCPTVEKREWTIDPHFLYHRIMEWLGRDLRDPCLLIIFHLLLYILYFFILFYFYFTQTAEFCLSYHYGSQSMSLITTSSEPLSINWGFFLQGMLLSWSPWNM